MANLNKVMLIGNLTRDVEIRHTPKGTAVADLGLAINRYYQSDNGERQEETTFVDVTVWGKQAELAQQFLYKGRPVYIEGRLQMDTWEDKNDGKKRTKIKVVAENIQFLGSRGDGGGGGGGGYRGGDDEESGYGSRPAQRSGGGGYGGGQRGGGNAARSTPPQRPAATDEDYGDGPITDGQEEDEIPF